MATALVAIVLAFIRSEGCGRRYTQIGCVSFSPDGSRIAVSKMNARNSRTPGKHYIANVSRTLSILAASDGTALGILHRDFKPGNQGPAFALWAAGRTSIALNPVSDHLVALEFGGGNLTQYALDGQTKTLAVRLQRPASGFSLSKSGRLVATSSWDDVTVYETTTGDSVMQVQADGLYLPFLHAPLLAFSGDEMRLVMASVKGIHVWDISTGTQSTTIIEGSEPRITAMAVAPNDTLLVCSDAWVRRYDFSGNIVSNLTDSRHCRACCISNDGQNAALLDAENVVIYNLASGEPAKFVPFDWATTIAFSPDGQSLAVGDNGGKVTLVDVRTGKRQWSSSPPGRYRWPWTLPACVLAVWSYVAWRLSLKARAVDNDSRSTQQ